jgi:hypothetical protein
MRQKTIRFRQPWRGRQPGDLDNALDFGVASELVRRGIAEFVVGQAAPQPKGQRNAEKKPKRR